LPHLIGWIDARRALARDYTSALTPLQQQGMLELPAGDAGHSWQTFMVVLADCVDRAAVIRSLADAGIEANLGAQCVSAQPAFRGLAPKPDAASNALRLSRQGLALPFCEQYGSAEIARVSAVLTTALRGSHA
jgi:perosamine synthetase